MSPRLWLDRLRFYCDAAAPELDGVWQRREDEFAGCRVLVLTNAGERSGVLVYVPSAMRQAGWEAGEVKWRSLARQDRRRFTLEDRCKTLDLTDGNAQSSFQPGWLVFATPHLIRVQAGERPGQWWQRVQG